MYCVVHLLRPCQEAQATQKKKSDHLAWEVRLGKDV